MKQYIDKAAVVAEIERRKQKLLDNIIYERDKEWVVRTAHQLNRIILSLDTLEVKEVENFIWNNARTTIPEDSTNQIICIKEDGLAVSTIGKIVNGTVKWAYLNDLLNTNSFNVEVKEEPESEDLEEAVENYAATGEVFPNGKVMINFQAEKAFRAGANWQKEHLIGKMEQFLYEELSNGDIECRDMKSLIEYFKSYMKEDKL